MWRPGQNWSFAVPRKWTGLQGLPRPHWKVLLWRGRFHVKCIVAHYQNLFISQVQRMWHKPKSMDNVVCIVQVLAVCMLITDCYICQNKSLCFLKVVWLAVLVHSLFLILLRKPALPKVLFLFLSLRRKRTSALPPKRPPMAMRSKSMKTKALSTSNHKLWYFCTLVLNTSAHYLSCSCLSLWGPRVLSCTYKSV